MKRLKPLELLFDRSRGRPLPLPEPLARVYGALRLPRRTVSPYIVGNFASTLDGVVSLQTQGHSGGGEITGFDPHDRLLMGILRATADAVIVGAGTLRSVPHHRWTAQHVFPGLATEFVELRRRLGKSAVPLNVIVTAQGRLDLTLPVFSSGEVPVLIVTTRTGRRRIYREDVPARVRVAAVGDRARLTARSVIRAVRSSDPHQILLVEGGPHLIGDFFAERCLDELFLTLAPQVAGRGAGADRPGLVAGRIFAPDHSVWGSLVGVRRGGSLLFLRFAFAAGSGTTGRKA